jgi:Fe-S cluster biosynthesis and repair protein YggX
MSASGDRIAQFRKMANDDPDNELGHFSLAKALLDAGQHAEAVPSFERTIALNPQFSKAYQLLASCHVQLGNKEQALQVLRDGFVVADKRGDNIPRTEMAAMLRQLGVEPPALQRVETAAVGVGGFRCQRPGCPYGSRARQLPNPPMRDALGQQIHECICADCWREWLGMGVKVINELRLDLSDEASQQKYDAYMKEYLGLN